MLGRAAVFAASALLLTGGASAQTADTAAPAAKATAKVEPGSQPLAVEPDPLTPQEVQASPPAAPGATAVAAPEPAAVATADAVVLEIRKRLAGARGREGAGDAADRAALTAFYETDTSTAIWSTEQGFTPRARLALAEIGRADDWGLKASAFDLPKLPDTPSVEARADADIKLGLSALRYARHARGGRIDPSSLSKLFDRKPQVFEPRSLIRAFANQEAPDAYLRGLHPRHAGFRNLQKALVAARHAAAEPVVEQPAAVDAPASGKRGKAPIRPPVSAGRSETIQRLVVNMERWRWMPDDLGAFHVWNNIPDQITTVYSSGKVVFTERIVVGKADTATPNFSADMQFVIFQPEWGVPGGIKNNELAPMLRRASSEGGGWFGDSGRTPSAMLARHGLRVSLGNQIVNPDNVNWSAVDINRFNFVQPGGGKNVLGVVKFRFPNKHDVYMHDTPERHLFNSGVRAFSHGCMRVQNPVRFAEVLLEHDKGWSADKVRSLVPHSNEVKLTTQIPVHNVYFTAVADETGKVRTAGDLYGSDSRVASALEGRSIAVASRAGEPAAGGPAAVADGNGDIPQRVKGEPRQGHQQRRTTASNQGFNPFAGLFGN